MKNTLDLPLNSPLDRYEFDEDDEVTKFSDFFIPLQILGSGSFGTCVSAQDLYNNQVYAVKIIPKKRFHALKNFDILSEAKILYQLHHPNIVKFVNVIETDTKLLVITELMKGGSLKKFLAERNANANPLSDQEASTIMKKIISALHYMHNKGIVHRDLKPENILLGDIEDLNTVKICDFGLSGQFENFEELYNVNTFAEFCGTRIYMAPEIFENKSYGKSVDIWSAGIILYMLLAQGQHPIYKPGDSSEKYEDKLRTLTWEFPLSFNKHSKHLFLHLVDRHPHNRYTAEQILNHPWISRCFDREPPKTLSESLGIFSNTQNFQRMIKLLYIFARVDCLKPKKEKTKPSPLLSSEATTLDSNTSVENTPKNHFRSIESSENDPGVINRKYSLLSEGELVKPRIKGIKLKKVAETVIKLRKEAPIIPSSSSSKLRSTVTNLPNKLGSTSSVTLNSLPDEVSESKKRLRNLARLVGVPSLPNLDVQTEEPKLRDKLIRATQKIIANNPNPNTPRSRNTDSYKYLNNRKFKEMLMPSEEPPTREHLKQVPVSENPKHKTPRKLRPMRELSRNEKQNSKLQITHDEYLFGAKNSGRGAPSVNVRSPANRLNVTQTATFFGKVA